MERKLPEGWKVVHLEKVVEILDNQRVPINSEERAKRKGGIPYYGATGQVGVIDDFLFDEELVLLGEDGAPFFDNKKNIAYLIEGKSWVNNHAHVLKGKNGILLNKMLLHFLNQFDYNGFVSGTTRLKLTQGSLKKLPIPLPLAEQERIVARLDALFAGVARVRERLERVPALLRQFRQSVLARAVSGELTADWRAEHPEVESIQIISTSSDNMSEIEVPDSWNWYLISDLCKITGGVTKGRKLEGMKTVKLPYLRVANVQDGYLDLDEIKEIEIKENEVEKYLLKKGDILFTEGGDRDKLGRGTIWKNEVKNCIHQNHIFKARVQFSDVDPKFITIVTKAEYAKIFFFSKAKQSVNLASINLSTLKSLPIPLPSLAEQQEIVRRVEALFAVADRLEAYYDALWERVEQLPRSMLARAFRGELVPQKAADAAVSLAES